MDKLRKLALISLAIIGILIFGAWTPYNANEPIRYVGEPILATRSSETIYFTRREIVEEKCTPKNTPQYRQLSGYSNSCGPVAGSIIVGYYDKYYPDLIPGWESFYSSGVYRFQDTVYVPELFKELYKLMRTNVDDAGVSEYDFKNGLKQYVNNNGYNLQYQSLGSGTNFNYEDYKKAIDSNKVVALLTLPCDVYKLAQNDTYDYAGAFNIAGPHIMVGYGYAQIKYYNEKGLFRTDTYLEVAVGDNVKTALYRVESNNLTAAYVVNIT